MRTKEVTRPPNFLQLCSASAFYPSPLSSGANLTTDLPAQQSVLSADMFSFTPKILPPKIMFMNF